MSTARVAAKMIRVAFIGTLVAAAALLAAAVVTGGNGLVAGHRLVVATSGSMSPTFRTGDLLVETPVRPSDTRTLRPGQIITFDAPGAAAGGVSTFTHRIVGVSAAGYTTKGDANNGPDFSLVKPAQVRDVYERRVPAAGRLIVLAHTRAGLALLVALAALPLVAGEFGRRWKEGSAPIAPSPA